MGAPQLNLTVKPQEFFREKVTSALANQRIKVGDDVEFYLVNLLCEFIAPGKLETVVGELNALETPLAIMMKQALEAPPVQRLRIYKYLGDTSLYVAGFFQDYFNRKAFDIGYYISLGASAYENVSVLFKDQHGDENFRIMYNDLAAQFQALVDIVAEVSEIPGSDKPLDILAVYDRWTRSNSERLRKMLHKVGITPIMTPFREKQ
jgi:hypothetical protein